MSRKTTNLEAVATIGIDIGKNTFHLIGLDKKGRDRSPPEAVARPSWYSARQHAALPHRHGGVRRGASPEPATEGARPRCATDACWYVRPDSKGQKNDFRDAEAIAEAVLRPTMKFVAIKTVEQLDLQGLHRVRERLVCQRTSVINQVRAFLLERGIAVRQGLRALRVVRSG